MTRRALLGGVVGALAVSPFIIKHFRKTTPLPEGYVDTFPRAIDPSIVPSGKVDVVYDPVTFVPLTLPSEGIISWTQNAVLSNDNKWLLVSHCFGDDCQSQICYAPLDKSGLPETFVKLKDFGPKSVVTGLGCSSLDNRTGGRLSCRLQKFEEQKPDDGGITFSLSLVCADLQTKGKTLEHSSESVVLRKDEFPAKSWGPLPVGQYNHRWLEGQNAFLAVLGFNTRQDLYRVDCEDNDKDNRLQVLRPLKNGDLHRDIGSNLFLDDKTITFLEAPMRLRGKDEKWNGAIDSYRTDPDGLLVSLNLDGTTNSEKSFPVPLYSYLRKTLITKTHCFFRSIPSGQFFVIASFEKPQDYIKLGFALDEIQLPDSGINYIFEPLLILPSGRHLLCARDVGNVFVKKAQELGLPLSTRDYRTSLQSRLECIRLAF